MYRSVNIIMNSFVISQNPEIIGHTSTSELDQIVKLQSQVLEKVVLDISPQTIFDEICNFIEQTVPDCVTSVMLFDDSHSHLNIACAPSIPEEGINLLDGLVPGVGAGSCGTSVYLGSPVYVVDTSTDNRWDHLRHLADKFGIRACWSYPIRLDAEQITGSIAISSFAPRTPSPFHDQLLATASNVIGIVIKRYKAQQRLDKTQRLLQEITKEMPGVMFQYQLTPDDHLQFNYISEGIEALTGLSATQAIADYKQICAHIHHDDQHRFEANLHRAHLSKNSWSYEFRLRDANGEIRWIRGSASPEVDNPQPGSIWNGLLLDITPEKASIEQLRLAGIAFSSTHEGIMITDRTNKVIDVNRAYAEMCGCTQDELIGKPSALLSSEHHSSAFYQSIEETLQAEGYWQGEIWDRKPNGAITPHRVSINAVYEPNTEQLSHYVSVIADISHLKASEAKLSHLTHHDILTNLPNRLLFSAKLDHAMTHRSEQNKLAMLHLNLDRFKHINDSLGHQYGDQLLLQVSQRLEETLAVHDTLARIGGDEFAILLENIEHAADASEQAEKLIAVMQHPFLLDEQEYFCTASIGIALSPDHTESLDELFQQADIALNQAKGQGKNKFAFFQPALSETVEEWIKLEPLLRKAVAEKQFVIYYQPQFDRTGTQLRGAEALIRWQHPTLGIIPPGQFLPIAEEIGLMPEIGSWVLTEGIRQLGHWYAQGIEDFRLSINLASEQIKTAGLVDEITSLLQQYQVPAEMLELEILETFLLEDEAQAITVFDALRATGIHLALDDFGTGYSSLSYLKRLPVTKVKIDQSLIRDITTDQDDEAIIKAVILLSHTLKLTVCAEGVEDAEQQAFLQEANCDQLQGYLFSKPVPVDDFDRLLFASN